METQDIPKIQPQIKDPFIKPAKWDDKDTLSAWKTENATRRGSQDGKWYDWEENPE